MKELNMSNVKQSLSVFCTLNWAHLKDVSQQSDSFQVDCSNLSEADQEGLTAIGLGPRLQDDDHAAKAKKWKREGKFSPDDIKDKLESLPVKETFMTVKSNLKADQWRRDPDDLRWFTVKKQVSPTTLENFEDLGSVGNGTTAIVKIEAVPYDNQFGKGFKASLAKIILVDLVKYESKATDEVDEETDMLAMIQGITGKTEADFANDGDEVAFE